MKLAYFEEILGVQSNFEYIHKHLTINIVKLCNVVQIKFSNYFFSNTYLLDEIYFTWYIFRADSEKSNINAS